MNTLKCFLTLCLAGVVATDAFGADRETTMTFPKPGEQGILRIVSGQGDITITGHSGSNVVISTDGDIRLSEPDVTDERARGLRKISGSSFSIATDDEKNAIVINRSMQEDTDLTIQVPIRTSVYIGGSAWGVQTMDEYGKSVQKIQEKAEKTQEKAAAARDKALAQQEDREAAARDRVLAAEDRARTSGGTSVVVSNGDRFVVPMPMNIGISIPRWGGLGSILEGDISISGISGNVEVNAIEGDITITGINGSIVASSVDGDINAELVRLTGDNPLSFSSVDGDIDVTLPGSLNADINLKSTDGDIYTNFDIAIAPTPPTQGSADIMFFGGGIGSTIYGTINGGGRDVTLKSVDGNIYLRKTD